MNIKRVGIYLADDFFQLEVNQLGVQRQNALFQNRGLTPIKINTSHYIDL